MKEHQKKVMNTFFEKMYGNLEFKENRFCFMWIKNEQAIVRLFKGGYAMDIFEPYLYCFLDMFSISLPELKYNDEIVNLMIPHFKYNDGTPAISRLIDNGRIDKLRIITIFNWKGYDDGGEY